MPNQPIASTRLQQQVVELLAAHGKPMRVSEIVPLIGRSTSAISAALKLSAAEPVPGSSPIEWRIHAAPSGQMAARHVPSKFEGSSYIVSSTAEPPTIDDWNERKAEVAGMLSGLAVTYKSDPVKLSEQLGTMAGTLAAIAYTLSAVADKPDWYALLTDRD